MRYITFLLYTAVMVLITILLGCSTENPLCSDNYCVSGQVFLRSQLLEDEEFSEVNVVESNLIAAFANATPVAPVATTPILPTAQVVSLANIIADVTENGTDSTYISQTVTITGYVVWKSNSGDSLVIYETASVIETTDQGAVLYILSKVEEDPVEFMNYNIGTSYTFTLQITSAAPPTDDRAYYIVGSRIAE